MTILTRDEILDKLAYITDNLTITNLRFKGVILAAYPDMISKDLTASDVGDEYWTLDYGDKKYINLLLLEEAFNILRSQFINSDINNGNETYLNYTFEDYLLYLQEFAKLDIFPNIISVTDKYIEQENPLANGYKVVTKNIATPEVKLSLEKLATNKIDLGDNYFGLHDEDIHSFCINENKKVMLWSAARVMIIPKTWFETTPFTIDYDNHDLDD